MTTALPPSRHVFVVRDEEHCTDKWVLIELQGELCLTSGGGDAQPTLGGKDLGKMTVGNDGMASLVIGNHRLEGKRTTLAKPFAVLKKARMVMEDDGEDQGKSTKTEFRLVGMVDSKVMFKTRPKPLVDEQHKGR